MIRIVFRKTGYLRYISHLDLQRTMQRALTRAQIPLWYTEGFNPHPYLCFASSLPVGVNSVTEMFDIKPDAENRMAVEEIKERLSKALPEDLGVTDVYETDTSLNNIAFAEYTFSVDSEFSADFENFFDRDRIPVIRKTKRSEEEIDLREEMKNIKKENGKVTLTLPAGNERAIKPLLVITAFRKLCGNDTGYFITREKFFKKDLTLFK